MNRALFLGPVGLVVLASACGEPPAPKVPVEKPKVPLSTIQPTPTETHLADLKQVTLAGENAEAYWAWGGRDLILQSRTGDNDCDRIYRMPLSSVFNLPSGSRETVPPLIPVSDGKGATTCSYFLPGDQKVIYASTELGGAACPPKPDRSKGYVWALYDTYDIFKSDDNGKNQVRLTDTKGYDAEGTVCAKDGSIVFTSLRDGDIDLYRMDSNGKNVQRLTNTPGYDGGAFFNADCSKIVWRASRPKPGKALDDFKALLLENPPLVRPSKLELMVMNADGSDQQQITYLDAASFAPYWHPSQKRILFSSNYGDPKGREFDIWAVNTDGTALEKITDAPGFDGFPMFSPDGKLLAFSSNRQTPPGKHDTNVFVARWNENGKSTIQETGADRIKKDVVWLADPARQGRGVGLVGLEQSGAYIEDRMKALALQPEGDANGFRQAFAVVTSLKQEDGTSVAIDGKALAKTDYAVLGYSPAKANVSGDFVFADYGIISKEKDNARDDYAKLDVKKKIVVVRRFVPDSFGTPEMQRRYGDIRRKAFWAREKGAAALVVIDAPVTTAGQKMPDEAHMPALQPEGYSDAGLPVVVVNRAAGLPLVDKLVAKGHAKGTINVQLTPVSSQAFNVAGRLIAEPKDGKKLPGVMVIGAHYDHLGMGGRFSLSPHANEPHVGADDNASGASTLLEVARDLAARRTELKRDVVFVAFSAEESGVLGSAHFVQQWIKWSNDHAPKDPKTGKPPKGWKPSTKLTDVYAMLNMDMVGRMRDNRLQVLGAETATEWNGMIETACATNRVDCAASGDGYGPSDHINFYSGGVPVLHFFTGTHSDYHKPSDTPDKLNYAGAMETGKILADIALASAAREQPLTFKADVSGPAPQGDMRSFNASLGSIPDYGGPGPGKKGVLLAGVRPGGAADKGGLKKGDVLIRLGKSEIGSVEDLMFVLNASKPGETVAAIVLRDGKEVKMDVTFQEATRPR